MGMRTPLYGKRFRYFIRLDKNGQPILGTFIARKKKPEGKGWLDITAGINFCCNAEFVPAVADEPIPAPPPAPLDDEEEDD
jgi:hypothetical protein